MQRTVRASLGRIVLGFELIVTFLAALVVSGLGLVELVTVVVATAIVMTLMLVSIVFLARPFSLVLGWLVQVLMTLTGFVLPMLFVIGIIFTALWVFAMIMGARLDSQKGSAP